MNPVFGNDKELLSEYHYLVKEILPSLNGCCFCGKLKCKFCPKCFVNSNMCRAGKCLNCHRFNKSKDILINSDNEIISNYVKKFLNNYFKVSDLTNYLLNMNINQIVKDKDPTIIVKFDYQKVESPPEKEEEKKYFCFKSKKFRHYCKLI